MVTIRALSSGQQQFLQRLLALQVASDAECRTLYEQVCNSCPDDFMGQSLEHCIGKINASLVPGFDMEIRTVEIVEQHE